MIPQWVIETKRDGGELPEADIRAFIEGYTRGDIPDYQMAALAMAIFFRGMSFPEVTVLTDAMMRSGAIMDTRSIALPKVDKHSTGGIGDKVSLVLAPLLACCDVAVPMISGRGLGITGGTLDKLDAIEGYRTDLSGEEFLATIQACGCSITGQTESLAPADRKLYALRDVTGTVPSIPLISASIMSKKLAEGTDALVLDVKFGSGAFMKTAEEARELGRTMVEIGARMGKGMSALLTDMSQPLGRTAGNALEVRETIDTLRGEGPADFVELTLELCAESLILCGGADTRDAALDRLRQALDSGAAYTRFCRMVELQGGNTAVIDHPERLPTASIREPLPAPQDGVVARMDADGIGRACLVLGAGRVRTDASIDPAVGISDMLKVGEPVAAGDPLLVLHANDQGKLAEARERLADAVDIAPGPVAAPPLILETLQPDVTPP